MNASDYVRIVCAFFQSFRYFERRGIASGTATKPATAQERASPSCSQWPTPNTSFKRTCLRQAA